MASKKRLLLSVASFFILVAISGIAFAQSSKEAEGEAAEHAGRLREALTNYTTVLQATTPGSDAEQRLLERAATISSKVSPSPALPAEAERRLVRGQALVESARDADAFMRAAAEFRAALRAAPWLADAHYNLGIVLDKAQRFSEAIRSLKLSILAAPNAKEAGETQRLIYRIEVRQEEAQRAKAEAERKALDAQRAEAESRKRRFESLAGRWVSISDGQSAYQTEYYQITVTGPDSFSLKYVSGSCTPKGTGATSCSGSIASLLVEATANGDQISGRASFQARSNFGACAGQWFRYPIHGSISGDGKMQVTIFPDFKRVYPACEVEDPKPNQIQTLTRTGN